MSLKEYITEKEKKENINPATLVDDVVKALKSGGLKLDDGLKVTSIWFEGKSEIKKIAEVLNKKLGEGIKSEGEVIYDGGKDYNVKIKKDGDKIKAKISIGGAK